MAKTFDKRIDVFLKSEHATEFIKALLFTLNGGNKKNLSPPYGGNKKDLSPPNGGDKIEITRDDIIQTNKKGGTFMHRSLALKFAAWSNHLNYHHSVYKLLQVISQSFSGL